MDADAEQEELLVEEREAEMVALTGPPEPTKRNAWFLNPSATSDGNSPADPFVPTRYKNVSLLDLEDPKVLFKGWSSSPRQWEQWVCKLRPNYGDTWKKVGIFDALMASTYRIRRDPSSLFGVASFWCDETNSFLFPWGEVTITLEDVLILGGFSVLGEPVRGPLPKEFKDVELKITEERLSFNRSACKKAHHSAWMKHFMERGGDDLEHVGFLSLWLSRFVFSTHPEMTIRQHIFPIAIRLAQGIRIALGPAVLASIYRDLREVKEYLVSNANNKELPIVVWAPFHILQLWVWERFTGLSPEVQSPIKDGEPRPARWHEVGKKLELSFVQSVLASPNNFLWRPYANWCKIDPSGDNSERVQGHAAGDEGLASFAQCLGACELVGVDCIEKYLPHRVAMQFGFDQDIPAGVAWSNTGWEAAWETYDIMTRNVALYATPQNFEPGITVQYSRWWTDYMLHCGTTAVESTKEPKTPLLDVKRPLMKLTQEKMESRKKKARILSTDKKRKLQDLYDTTLSDWLAFESPTVSGKKTLMKSEELSPDILLVRKEQPFTMKPRMQRKQDKPSKAETKHQSEALGDKIDETTQSGEATASALSAEKENIVAETVERANDGDYTIESPVSKEPEGDPAPKHAIQKEENETIADGVEEKLTVEHVTGLEKEGSCDNLSVVKEPEEIIKGAQMMDGEVLPLELENKREEDRQRLDNGTKETVVLEDNKEKNELESAGDLAVVKEADDVLPPVQANPTRDNMDSGDKNEEDAVAIGDVKRINDRESDCHSSVAREPEETLRPELAEKREDERMDVEEKNILEIVDRIINGGDPLSDPSVMADKAKPEHAIEGEEGKNICDKNEKKAFPEDVSKITDGGASADPTSLEVETILPPEQTDILGEDKEMLDADKGKKDADMSDANKEGKDAEMLDANKEEKDAVDVDMINTCASLSVLNNMLADGTIPFKQVDEGGDNQGPHKDLEHKAILEDGKKINNEDSPCSSIVINAAEEVLPEKQASQGEGNEAILEKDLKEPAIAEEANKIAAVGSPQDPTFVKESEATLLPNLVNQGGENNASVGESRITINGESACGSITSPHQLEGKEAVEDVERTGNGEAPYELQGIKELEGTLAPEQEKPNMEDNRRRNSSHSAYQPVKGTASSGSDRTAMKNAIKESVSDLIVEEETEVNVPPWLANYKIARIEDLRASRIAEESELEMQIRKLKEEIAAIEAKVMNLESITEVYSGS